MDSNLNWKSLYASDVFDWQQTSVNGVHVQYRRLGIVESLFDLDGIDYEGRADMNMHCKTEIATTLTNDEFQQRIVLAWAYMRGLHPLLACKSLYTEDFLPQARGRRWVDKCFVYDKPSSRQQSIERAQRTVTFMQNVYPDADVDDFYNHLLNTGRAVDAEECLSRLIVMPLQRTESGTAVLNTILVTGHQVADGITAFRLNSSLVDVLNMKESDLLDRIDRICSEHGDPGVVFPDAQEKLYPVYGTTVVKNRWNWAITRILRHVRRPAPAAFQNPLLRTRGPLQTAARMPSKYTQVLDYAKTPVLNGGWLGVDLSPRATSNLVKLCRQAGISIGSGAFTLVGMVMMQFEEAHHPGIPHWERLPFVGSFPVNPRPFLSGTPTTGKEDSLMLAFSDGVTLPFVPSDLDFAKAFRVLGRLAHRQLRQYQKRKRTPAEEAHLGSRSPRELLPALYLSTMERLEMRAKPEQRVGVNAQNAYPATSAPTLATCGISSVGNRTSLAASGKHDLKDRSGDVVADFRDMKSAVRPRNGEFLVGAVGAETTMRFGVSYDACAIDPEKAEAWKRTLLTILDFDVGPGVDEKQPPISLSVTEPKL